MSMRMRSSMRSRVAAAHSESAKRSSSDIARRATAPSPPMPTAQRRFISLSTSARGPRLPRGVSVKLDSPDRSDEILHPSPRITNLAVAGNKLVHDGRAAIRCEQGRPIKPEPGLGLLLRALCSARTYRRDTTCASSPDDRRRSGNCSSNRYSMGAGRTAARKGALTRRSTSA